MEKKVHFKLHKVKKHWVTIAVTGLTLGLSFAGLNYASAEEHHTPVNEATVEAIIKEGAIDVEAPATNEATAKPVENTPSTASSETATVSEAPVAASEVASSETVSEKPSSEVTSTFVSASETQNSESKSSVATSVTEKTAEETASHEDRTIDVTDRGIYPPPPWSSRVENVTGGEYYTDDDGFWHYRNENGDDYIDGHTIDGVKVYFDYKGRQVKGRFGLDQHFYDKDSGALVTSSYVNDGYNTYYVNKEGYRLIGHQKINGDWTYFNDSGAQLKESFDPEGRYYDKNGLRTDLGTNHYVQLHNKWYYIGNDGKILKGPQTIDGVKVYFSNYDGIQVKGDFASDEHYYDKDSGALVTNRFVHSMYDFFVDENGNRVTGQKNIGGAWYYFSPAQIKDEFGPDGYYYDKEGKRTDLGTNRYYQLHTHWYYIGKDGKILKGPQTIDGMNVYFDTDGKQVKGHFAADNRFYDKNNGWLVTNRIVNMYGDKTYYIDENGYKFTGVKEINGALYYFEPEQVFNKFAENGRYYDDKGKQVDFGTNRFFHLNGYCYYAGDDGTILTGRQTINGMDIYFENTGVQVKGRFISDYSGKNFRYYDKDSGALVKNQYVIAYNSTTGQNERYYLDNQGQPLTGPQTIDGKQVYFHELGNYSNNYGGWQIFDNFAEGRYYDQDGNLVDLGKNRYVQIKENWYYVGNDGKILTGYHTIDGVDVYFDNNGVQAKGTFDSNGRFHDKDTGGLIYNQFITVKDKTYYIDDEGRPVEGLAVIKNTEYFFDKQKGAQIKGDFAVNGKYYDGITGALVTNSYVRVGSDWYYVNSKGKRLKGAQIINNVAVYFNPQNGKQLKGGFDEDGYFYDKDSGAKTDLGKNHYVQINDAWYYIGSEGKILKGEQTIDGVQVHFDTITGVQVKGNFITKDGRLITEKDHASYTPAEKFFDKDSGALVKGRYFTHKGKWYYANDQGILLKGSQTIDGVNVYFHPYYFGGQAKDLVLDGYYYDKDTGARQEIPKNTFFKAGNKLYYFDSNGDFGRMTIDGKDYCVYSWGEVIRGGLGPYNTLPYYDEETGAAIHKTGLIKSGNNWFYLDENGRKVKGLREINGKIYYFSDGPESRYGHYYDQVRGLLVNPYNENYYNSTSKAAPTYFFDAETGAALTNQFFNWEGDWYYFGPDGKALIFDQVINGQHLYFRNNGKQVKGQFISDYKGTRYYDENSGELVTNQTRTINGATYQFDENGRPTQL